MNARQDAAVRYASTGWPVFPCKPDAKEPATKHGVLDAETDPRTITRWWSRHPDANVGIATGAPGPTVLDVDIANGKPGHKSLNEAIRAGLVPSPAALIRTPSGGSHLYYEGDAQGNGSMPKHGLDLRGKGGYVVAPPSTVDGRPYVVVSHSAEPASIDFAAIREHLAPQPQRPAWPHEGREPGVAHLAGWVGELSEGNRNAGTFWAACRAAEAGDADALAAIVRAAVSTGLDQRSVDKTIASAQRTASPKAIESQAGSRRTGTTEGEHQMTRDQPRQAPDYDIAMGQPPGGLAPEDPRYGMGNHAEELTGDLAQARAVHARAEISRAAAGFRQHEADREAG